MTRAQAAKILGVYPDISEEELKKRFRALMLMTHPDSVSEHDYPYEVHEIIEAYEYLSLHLEDAKKRESARQERQIKWGAPVNPNAYIDRPIYQYYEDNDGERLGIVSVDYGKYMWIPDEDFSLFLKSLYFAAKQVVSENTSLLADIAYLLAGQFFGSDMALSLMTNKEDNIYYSKAMLELSDVTTKPRAGSALIPSGVRNHRLYVNDTKGNELGYISFKDDRLLFGIVPLFERRAVQVKMETCEYKKNAKSIDVDFWLKQIPEETNAVDSINMKIRDLLNR